MRYAIVAAVGIGLAALAPAIPAAAEDGPPNLSGYASTPVEPFLDTAVNGGEVYFQTPDGLLCAIRPSVGRAGCDGELPGAPSAANEIVLSSDSTLRGFRATATPQFVKPTGAAAPVLAVGHKIAIADFECAVGAGPTTMCTKGSPAEQWLTIAGSGSGIGPATAGLPAGVPDPIDFVGSDDSYLVGSGAKNLFPVFTVGDGLQCKMAMFSGGTIGCNGKLPGVTDGDDEVFVQLPGPLGTRKASSPPVSAPMYPGPIRQLPPQHRIDSFGGTCMATEDGGVTCLGAAGGPVQGFVVGSEQTKTFVGG